MFDGQRPSNSLEGFDPVRTAVSDGLALQHGQFVTSQERGGERLRLLTVLMSDGADLGLQTGVFRSSGSQFVLGCLKSFRNDDPVIVESFGMLVYFGLVIRIPGVLTFVRIGYFRVTDRGGGASFSAPVYIELRDLASTAVRRIKDAKPPFVSVFDQ